jgi:hypothetical protein
MTPKEKEKYNRMIETLRMISREYKSIEDFRKLSYMDDPVKYVRCLETVYSNIKTHAEDCVKGIRKVK